MPTIALEIPNRSVDCIMQELPGKMSRLSATIPAGTGKVEAGTVLGKVTSSGAYVPFEGSLTNGAQTAVAISLYDVDATASDQLVAAIFQVADMDQGKIKWASTVDNTEKAAAESSLAAQRVRFLRRTEVA